MHLTNLIRKHHTVVLSLDRTLWPFTIEYNKNIERILLSEQTLNHVCKTKDVFKNILDMGCTMHIASVCSNKKKAMQLLDRYYGDIPFESIVFDPSQYKMKHMSKIFPTTESSFCFFDSNIDTLSKIQSNYPNSACYHSTTLLD